MQYVLVYGMTYTAQLTYRVFDTGIHVSFCELTVKRQQCKKGTFQFIGVFPTWNEALGIWPKDTCKCVVISGV